jgi:hypothetical protein
MFTTCFKMRWRYTHLQCMPENDVKIHICLLHACKCSEGWQVYTLSICGRSHKSPRTVTTEFIRWEAAAVQLLRSSPANGPTPRTQQGSLRPVHCMTQRRELLSQLVTRPKTCIAIAHANAFFANSELLIEDRVSYRTLDNSSFQLHKSRGL